MFRMALIDRIGRLNGPLRITCSACGHQALWHPRDAKAKLGGECTTIAAKRRLKCSACGERRTYMIEFSA
jgi:DNA-directed RNA polymerase subunit RPC12/RpoP